MLEGVKATYTAPAVQRLFDAGAIMHARTTTPEYAHAGYTYSALWGVTRIHGISITLPGDLRAAPARPWRLE